MDKRDRSGRRDKKHGYSSKPRKRKAWNKGLAQEEQKTKKKEATSTSSKKLKEIIYPESTYEGFRLFDLDFLRRAISESSSCKLCGGEITLEELSNNGLGGEFSITCQECFKINKFSSCKKLRERKSSYEANRRSILGMRMIGHGLEGLRTFCGVMDLPVPVFQNSFDKIQDKILEAATVVAQSSMRQAVEEEIEEEKRIKVLVQNQEQSNGISCQQQQAMDTTDENEPQDLTAKGDGTWQKKGFSSLNGAVSLLGSRVDKVMDFEVLTSYCKSCTQWTKDNGPRTGEKWDTWYQQHKPHCNSNYTGSSGGMECTGMLSIFRRSVENYNVRYTNYIGDGDTKTFLRIQQNQPYGPTHTVNKIECIGHVGKRFGYHLRKLKKLSRGKKLSDGKGLFGKGRLTDAWIIKLQVFYAGAIRNNPESVSSMMRDIWAIWYHIGSSDENPQHNLCPVGEKSWCKYQVAAATGTLNNFHHTKNLPPAVCEEIKEVFIKMTSFQLLKRCLGGHTQNSNESFNNVLWKLCPKNVFVGHKTVRLAANIATTLFNDGMSGLLSIMKELQLEPGINSIKAAKRHDERRQYMAEKKVTEENKELRAAFKKLHVEQQQQLLQEEGNPYEAGAY